MTKSPETAAREHRLAVKLRENLRRRKEQARARAAGAAPEDALETGDSTDEQAALKPADDSDSRT